MSETRIVVRDNGNLRVEGPVTIVDPEGRVIEVSETGPVFLCRCGHSANKPFCDSSHRAAGFESVVRAPAAEAPGA